ncbi:MAG: hypothetical protein ABS79_02515 [Planctomycetes bacterium SCN 63-9]|nr:MAG: hypothetical protein ABS79_02515 [Planctomycetes bacterium SCN 63-9]
MNECVIVLGPYRSGTSLTAQLLERLGVDFGPRAERIATNAFNPGGYLERGDLNAINRGLITSAGRSLGAPGNPESLTRLADRSILDGVSLPWPEHGPLWGLKDPRFCATLKIWIDTGALRSDLVRIVRLLRDPAAIVRSSLEHPSVRKFCGDDPEVARRMVQDYIALADWQIQTLGVPAFLLTYEDLLRNPPRETARIADWLGIPDRQRIASAARLVGKQSARRRYYLHRSLTLPFRAVRKAYRMASGR